MEDQLPSLLDRLSDPTLQPGRVRYSLNQYEDSVRRDLVELLNTHRPREGTFRGLKEVENSIANYGLKDMTGLDESDLTQRLAFAEHIKQVIENHEPRLSNVQVETRNSDEVASEDRRNFKLAALYFRIRGTLNIDPSPIDGIVFDSVLELVSGKYDVARGA